MAQRRASYALFERADRPHRAVARSFHRACPARPRAPAHGSADLRERPLELQRARLQSWRESRLAAAGFDTLGPHDGGWRGYRRSERTENFNTLRQPQFRSDCPQFDGPARNEPTRAGDRRDPAQVAAAILRFPMDQDQLRALLE